MLTKSQMYSTPTGSTSGEMTPHSVNVARPSVMDLPQQFSATHKRLRLLARGGQANVFFCRGKTDNKFYVEKVFKEGCRARRSRNDILEILQYSLSANELFVQTLQFASPESPDLLMEYCNGGDLAMLQDDFRDAKEEIPEVFIWHVFLRLTEAICFLHTGHGMSKPFHHWDPIIHRDIKPENIMLAQDPANPAGFPLIKLADFDLAGFYNPDHCRFLSGSPIWQPPEQVRDFRNRTATPAGDVWAVGAVIHSLACQRAPGQEMSSESVESNPEEARILDVLRERRLNCFKRLELSYTNCLEGCMGGALAMDPKDRYNACGLLERVTPCANFAFMVYGREMPPPDDPKSNFKPFRYQRVLDFSAN